MYKILLVASLLVAFGPVAAHSADPTSPIIVAKRRLRNQTAPIPTTTIFTPSNDGVYRLSVYATVTQADPASQSYWIWNPEWTDDAGPANCNAQCYIGAGNTQGQFLVQLGIAQGMVLIIEAKGGSPITFNVYQQGVPDNSAYSLYYVLEKIE